MREKVGEKSFLSAKNQKKNIYSEAKKCYLIKEKHK